MIICTCFNLFYWWLKWLQLFSTFAINDWQKDVIVRGFRTMESRCWRLRAINGPAHVVRPGGTLPELQFRLRDWWIEIVNGTPGVISLRGTYGPNMLRMDLSDISEAWRIEMSQDPFMYVSYWDNSIGSCNPWSVEMTCLYRGWYIIDVDLTTTVF